MKQLLTLTLVAVLGFAVIGCNKTEKVNASATASQRAASKSGPANCDPSKCESKAKAKPAAAAGKSGCCASKAKAKPAAAGACDPTKCGDMKDCDPSKCASMKKGAKMDCGKKDGKMSGGCPMSGGK